MNRYLTMAKLLASSRFSGGWTVAHNGTRIALENRIDFLTLYDLYVEHHYASLMERATAGAVLWDIGANLGAASLMFAQNPKVAHVYAYEPIPDTIEYARETMRLNPHLSGKITLRPIGVGGAEGTIDVRYTRKAKCAVGISDIPPSLKTIGRIKESDYQTVTISLTDAAAALRGIRLAHPEAPILLKLDAEGAEYQIIDRLYRAGVLSDICSAAIEWHGAPGPEYLVSRLRDAGFSTESRALVKDGSIGMINAHRDR